MMKVSKIVCDPNEVSRAKKQAVEELKEKMWKEVWKENIDLPQATVKVYNLGQDIFEVVASI